MAFTRCAFRLHIKVFACNGCVPLAAPGGLATLGAFPVPQSCLSPREECECGVTSLERPGLFCGGASAYLDHALSMRSLRRHQRVARRLDRHRDTQHRRITGWHHDHPSLPRLPADAARSLRLARTRRRSSLGPTFRRAAASRPRTREVVRGGF